MNDFTENHFASLRKEYEFIDRLDDFQYKQLKSFIKKLSFDHLDQLSKAGIKFVSSLCLNELNSRRVV